MLDGALTEGCRYRRGDGSEQVRTLRPLCLAFFGSTWLLGAWCELRRDFRSFRPDRMLDDEVLDEPFAEEPDKSLQSYIRRIEAQLDHA